MSHKRRVFPQLRSHTFVASTFFGIPRISIHSLPMTREIDGLCVGEIVHYY